MLVEAKKQQISLADREVNDCENYIKVKRTFTELSYASKWTRPECDDKERGAVRWFDK